MTPHLRHTCLLICFCCLFLFSCGEEEEISRYNSNISGQVEYQGRTFSMRGGLLDEKADSLFSRTTFQFKISPKPIEPVASYNEFAMYVSSDEEINLEIKLTSDNGNDIIKPGTYSFSELETSDVDFPQGLIAHYGYVFIATRTATTSSTQPFPIQEWRSYGQRCFPRLYFDILTLYGYWCFNRKRIRRVYHKGFMEQCLLFIS